MTEDKSQPVKNEVTLQTGIDEARLQAVLIVTVMGERSLQLTFRYDHEELANLAMELVSCGTRLRKLIEIKKSPLVLPPKEGLVTPFPS